MIEVRVIDVHQGLQAQPAIEVLARTCSQGALGVAKEIDAAGVKVDVDVVGPSGAARSVENIGRCFLENPGQAEEIGRPLEDVIARGAWIEDVEEEVAGIIDLP